MYVMCSMIRVSKPIIPTFRFLTRIVDYYGERSRLLRFAGLLKAHSSSNCHCSSSMAWHDALVRSSSSRPDTFLILSRPKSRDRLCRDAQYHDKYEDFKNCCNETISINWPYDAADTLIRTSANDFTINPVFITHIRTYSNWTLGPGFLEKWVSW